MKKIFLSALALSAIGVGMQAQEGVVRPGLLQNWSLGLNGGVTTPMTHHAFFGSMKGITGINVAKQISPVIGVGLEGYVSFNTSVWNNAVKSNAYGSMDNQYVGLYGTANLTRLFKGFSCTPSKFSIEALLGAGWGHDCWAKTPGIGDHNYFATRAGLNFNYAVMPQLTLALKPSVTWDMSDAGVSQSSAAYNANKAVFNCMVGVIFNLGGNGFKCVESTVTNTAGLNAQVNELRAQIAGNEAATAAMEAQNAALQNQLTACQNQGPKVVKENVNTLTSTRYVFYKNASSVITPDQQPNVEMIAQYMKNHPKSTVKIDGYASPTGPEELNIKLANARAESVKNSLIKKYGIAANRISAQGHGVGDMFSEESWNRVAICVLDN